MKPECKCQLVRRSQVGAHGEHESCRVADGTIVEVIELHEGGCVVAVHSNDSPLPSMFRMSDSDARFFAALLLRRSGQ